MRIILDTNILVQDWSLKSPKVLRLVDYVSKTDTCIDIPRIVREEVQIVFRRELRGNLHTFKRDIGKLSKQVRVTDVLFPEVDIEEETENYLTDLTRVFGGWKTNVLEHKPEFLQRLVDMSLKRKKPFSESGTGFHDGLIWLTILDTASAHKGDKIVFITDDKADFADSEGKLHVDLQHDIDEKGIDFEYYQDIDSFLRMHADHIEFLTKDWIQNTIDLRELKNLVSTDILPEYDIALDEHLEPEEIATLHEVQIDCVELELSDFFAYPIEKDRIDLRLMYYGELVLGYFAAVNGDFEKRRLELEAIFEIELFQREVTQSSLDEVIVGRKSFF